MTQTLRRAMIALVGLMAILAVGLEPASAQQPKAAPAAPTKAGSASSATVWHVGDKVSVYVGGSCCYDGTVAEVGRGSMAGYYLIHFDNPSSQDQYAKYSNVVARRAPAPTAAPVSPKALSPAVHCVMGTIGGKPVCLPTAPPG